MYKNNPLKYCSKDVQSSYYDASSSMWRPPDIPSFWCGSIESISNIQQPNNTHIQCRMCHISRVCQLYIINTHTHTVRSMCVCQVYSYRHHYTIDWVRIFINLTHSMINCFRGKDAYSRRKVTYLYHGSNAI